MITANILGIKAKQFFRSTKFQATTYNINYAILTSTVSKDPRYHDIQTPPVNITNLDNDYPGVTLTSQVYKLTPDSPTAQISVVMSYFYSDPGSLFSPDLAKWYRSQAKVPFVAIAFPKSSHMFISEYPEQFATELGKLL